MTSIQLSRPAGPPVQCPAATGPPALSTGWRLLAVGFAVAGAGLLPWMVYLAVSLPASPRAWHWPAAWIGLDAMEAAGLLCSGLLLLRRDVRYCLTALATAGVLCADAWFDCTTAQPGSGELTSVLMAIGAELPAAGLCLILGVAGLRRVLAAARLAPAPPGTAGSRAPGCRGPGERGL